MAEHSAENDAHLSPQSCSRCISLASSCCRHGVTVGTTRVAVTGGGEFAGMQGVVTDAWPSGVFEVQTDVGDTIECGGEYLRIILPEVGEPDA